MNLQFTIITVCYNVKNTIEKTILSVINQTYPNIEYIIIDGGSTDGTLEIIKKYSTQISYWCSEKDNGIFDAMNKGVNNSLNKNGFVNFLNAGDLFYSKDTIKKVAESIKHDSLYACGIAKYPNGRYWSPISKYRINIKDIYKGGNVNHQSSFININLLKEENYDTRYKIITDDLYFIKKVGIEKVKYQTINLIISLYDNTGISNDINKSNFMIEERKLFIKEHNLNVSSNLSKNKIERFKEIILKLFQWPFIRIFIEKRSK